MSDAISSKPSAASRSERDALGDLFPPWVQFPEIPFGAIAWRMGDGEACLDAYQAWYLALSGSKRRAVQQRDPARGDWRNFYFNLNRGGPREIARAAVIGALVGDALGVPFEFKAPEQIPPSDRIDMMMPAGFSRSHGRVPYGTWSDDGSQLLCLLETLADGDALPFAPGKFGALMVRWLQSAWHQAGGHVFDCGGQTARALGRIIQGVAAERAGGDDERSNGNGSLMRCLPVALMANLQAWSDDEMIDVAQIQSRVTHGHPLAQVCCAAYCLMAQKLMREPGLGAVACYLSASAELRKLYNSRRLTQHCAALDRVDGFPADNFRRGSGFVVDALWTAIECLDRSEGYADVVRAAIGYGNDTDSTACIAGGLAGIRYGLDRQPLVEKPLGIPRDWVEIMAVPRRSFDLLEKIFGEGFGRPE